jgi:hypothetical protein
MKARRQCRSECKINGAEQSADPNPGFCTWCLAEAAFPAVKVGRRLSDGNLRAGAGFLSAIWVGGFHDLHNGPNTSEMLANRLGYSLRRGRPARYYMFLFLRASSSMTGAASDSATGSGTAL